MDAGKTVEILNTDAEGRLVLADALVLAAEEQPDAIVNIGTLMRALGDQVAGAFGNHQGFVGQITATSSRTDEPVWQLPLEKRYRKQLDSYIADINNIGRDHVGAITAVLFLAELVGNIPWAHIDIAGTMYADAAES
jgi:leucyl aminopeptidase